MIQKFNDLAAFSSFSLYLSNIRRFPLLFLFSVNSGDTWEHTVNAGAIFRPEIRCHSFTALPWSPMFQTFEAIKPAYISSFVLTLISRYASSNAQVNRFGGEGSPIFTFLLLSSPPEFYVETELLSWLMKNNMYYSRGKNLLIYFTLKHKYLRWNESILYSFRIWKIFIAFYSWIIRVNFFFLYFFYHRFLIFPTLFPSKCWTRFHKVYYWTRVVVQFPRRKSSNRLLPALRNYTRPTPVLPSSPRSITVTRFEKVYFNWFNVRYPARGGEEGRGGGGGGEWKAPADSVVALKLFVRTYLRQMSIPSLP